MLQALITKQEACRIFVNSVQLDGRFVFSGNQSEILATIEVRRGLGAQGGPGCVPSWIQALPRDQFCFADSKIPANGNADEYHQPSQSPSSKRSLQERLAE